MGKISTFMLKEHGEILALLDKFDKTRKLADFEKLKEKQEKHMFAEEKAIFIFDKKKKIFPVLTTIMEQHGKLEDYMKEIYRDLQTTKTKDYKELMKKHIVLEDKEFYPLLDKKLTSVEQEEMLTKAKEYLFGTFAI